MYKIELTSEQVSEIVRQDLMQAYHLNQIVDKDESGFSIDNDTDFLYCLQRVIEYYSSPNQYETWQESLRD